jgi:UTP--glucose-1-phosphate uridylyltransferase
MKKEAEVVRRLTNLVDVRYVRQDQPLGLAHALCAAQPLVKQEPFAVLLPDVIMVTDEPVTRQLIRCRELHGGSVVAIREVAQHDVERHGIVEVSRLSNSNSDKAARVTRLVEKPSAATALSRLGVFGRYLLEPAIWDAIAQTKPDAHGEIQLTDALNLLCQTSLLVGLCFDGQHHDAGDQFGFIKANLELSLQYVRLREHS